MKFLITLVAITLSSRVQAQLNLNTFSPGTPISSSQMNANFTTIKNSVDILDASNAGLYIFPATDGSANQVLTTNGAGILSWQTVSGGGGGITSLNGLTSATQTFQTASTGTAPAWSSFSGIHTFSIPMASAAGVTAGLISRTEYDSFTSKENTISVSGPLAKTGSILSMSQASSFSDGYLSSTDWNVFNNKENAFTVNAPLSKAGSILTMSQASSGSDGYLSSADWTTFNSKMSAPAGSFGQVLYHNGSSWVGQALDAFMNNGNTFGTIANLGTNDGFPLTFKTNGTEKMRIDSSGNVGIGTGAPTAALHINSTTLNTVPLMIQGPSILTDPVGLIMATGQLNGSAGEQYGLKLAPIINQTTSGSYSALKIAVTHSGVGTGQKKLIDASVDGISKFTVNSSGLFSSNGFLGTLTNMGVPCDMTPPNGPQITSMSTMDFGVFSNPFVSDGAIYEIFIDLPMSGTGELYVLMINGGTTIKFKQGRNIKRLPPGNWIFELSCQGASPSTVTLDGPATVFGIRKLH